MTIEEFKQLLAEYEESLIQQETISSDAKVISYGGRSWGKLNKMKRAMEIMESVMNTAQAVTRQINLIPVAKRGRRITAAFRRKKALYWAKMSLIPLIGVSQVRRIAECPVPNYPKGGFHKIDIDEVGDGKESVIDPNTCVKFVLGPEQLPQHSMNTDWIGHDEKKPYLDEMGNLNIPMGQWPI